MFNRFLVVSKSINFDAHPSKLPSKNKGIRAHARSLNYQNTKLAYHTPVYDLQAPELVTARAILGQNFYEPEPLALAHNQRRAIVRVY